MRLLAEDYLGEKAGAIMRRLADDYDKLADRAEERAIENETAPMRLPQSNSAIAAVKAETGGPGAFQRPASSIPFVM